MEQSEDIDMSWISDYEKESKKYNMFYQESIKDINVYSIFVNKKKEIEEIKKSNIYLDKLNTISKEDLSKINNERDKKYKLVNIFAYNIDISNDNIRDYFFNLDKYNFIKSHNTLSEDLILNPTISFFHDVNSLYVLFYEITKNEKKKNTKKVLLSLSKPKTRKKYNDK